MNFRLLKREVWENIRPEDKENFFLYSLGTDVFVNHKLVMYLYFRREKKFICSFPERKITHLILLIILNSGLRKITGLQIIVISLHKERTIYRFRIFTLILQLFGYPGVVRTVKEPEKSIIILAPFFSS